MKFSKEKINDIWRSGYCRKTIEFVKNSKADDNNSRIEFIRQHILICRECRYANTLKDIENEVAIAMGRPWKILFDNGGNITTGESFGYWYKKIMRRAVRDSRISRSMIEWMDVVVCRRDYEKEKGDVN